MSVRRLAAGLVLTLALALLPAAVGQSDDFNDGNDTGWTHFDLGALGLNGAQYTFPTNAPGDRAYRIYAPPPVADVGAPALAISYAAPDYTRFVISVDVLNWATGIDQAYGIFARASDIGFPTIDGYTMNYNVADGDLQINEITDLGGQDTRAEVAVALNPSTGPYRWVFSGYEYNFLGQVFLLSDLVNPIASVVGVGVVGYDSGKGAVFVFNRDSNVTAPTSFGDATFDNYNASAPPAGSLRAAVLELQPTPHNVARAVPVPIKVAILDRETTVNPGSVVLTVDGQVVPSSSLTIENQVVVPNNAEPFPGVTITYTNTGVADLAGVHTNKVTFQDNTVTSQTYEWTYTFAYLRAINSTPPGSGRDPGFAVRLVQSITNQPLANSLARAEQQLAVPPQIAIDLTTNTTLPVINYTQNLVPNDPPSADGHFEDYATFPGIDPAGNTDDIAMEILAYLDLPAGTHTFGVTSDDGFQLRSGATLTDPNALVLGEKATGTYDGTFDIIAEQAGVYPFRMVWFERGGGAHVELFSVNRTTGERTLINDATSTIKAFKSVAAPAMGLQSSPSLSPASFQDDNSAVVNTETKTITTAQAGSQRFYRIKSGTALRIKTTQVSGGNVTLTYE
jgi:hypothetical protein